MIDQAMLQCSASKNCQTICLPTGSSMRETEFACITADYWCTRLSGTSHYTNLKPPQIEVDTSSVINSFKIKDESSHVLRDVYLESYEQLMEDLEIGQVIRARWEEPTISLGEMVQRLHDDGIL
jgi:hypothetical protein